MRDLPTMPPDEFAGLPMDQLAAIQSDLADARAELAAQSAALSAGLSLRFGGLAREKRAAKGEDTGSVVLRSGEYRVKADLPKKVAWDQTIMLSSLDALAVDDVTEYVDITYSIPESRWKAWPAVLQAVFRPARTVSGGTETFKIEEVKP